MNEDFNIKMRLLIKSEKALLALEMRKRGRQTLFIALALLSALLGLVMLNVTIYLYLSETYGQVVSAAVLTGINLTVTGIFFIIALRQDKGTEAASIEDIRDFAWEQVSTDLNEVKENVTELKNSIVQAKHSVDAFTSGDAFGIKKFLPIVTTLIELAKKKS